MTNQIRMTNGGGPSFAKASAVALRALADKTEGRRQSGVRDLRSQSRRAGTKPGGERCGQVRIDKEYA